MFRCLKTGLGGISPDECDILENYVIVWDIRGGMWLREGDWTASPDGYGREPTERSAARLERVNGIRRRVRLLLEPLYRGMRTAGAARQKAECLYGFLQEAGVPQTLEDTAKKLLEEDRPQLAEEYVQLWAIFCGVLDQFAEILGDTELSGEEFARLLRLVLTQYSVGTIPATLDQVKVSEITRNDRHRVKCLFLLGANDHVLPMPPAAAACWIRRTGPPCSSGKFCCRTPASTRWTTNCRIFTPVWPSPRTGSPSAGRWGTSTAASCGPPLWCSGWKSCFPGCV